MAYSNEYFLIALGFKKKDDPAPFCALGQTYSVNNSIMYGNYWFYDTEDFSINIHDFHMRQDYLFVGETTLLKDVLSVSFIKSVCGESIHPYRCVHNGCLYTFSKRDGTFRFFLHGGFPYFSVGFEYKKEFLLQNTKQLNIAFEEIQKAFDDLNDLNSAPKIEHIVDEIVAYNTTSPGSEIFYEAKVKEVLSYILKIYFEKKRIPAKRSLADDEALKNVCRYIDDHYAMDLNQSLLCTIAYMGKTKLKQCFKEKYDMTITEYIQRRRISIAEHMLISTRLKVSEVVRCVGYSSHSRFSALFKKYKGFSPQEFVEFVEDMKKSTQSFED